MRGGKVCEAYFADGKVCDAFTNERTAFAVLFLLCIAMQAFFSYNDRIKTILEDTTMKVSVIQMNMRSLESKANFDRAEALVRRAVEENGPDVVVLPETWNTGFFPKERLSELAEQDCARVKRELGGLAAELGVNLVAGSVANVRGGKVYNTACVFDRAGNCVAEYDKTHLFTPMGEHAYFTPGDHLCRFRLDGHDCGLVICYDIRFPELTRTLAVQGMDMLFVVSQWPAARIGHLRALTVARAIENQAFVICCNSCGDAGETHYGGASAIIDPWGELLAAGGQDEQILAADCELEMLDGIRSSINVFRDRRAELYRV